MPAIAVRWYLRALETPNLDEEATLAYNTIWALPINWPAIPARRWKDIPTFIVRISTSATLLRKFASSSTKPEGISTRYRGGTNLVQ